MKIVISEPSTRKAYQLEIDNAKSAALVGKKISEDFSGDLIGLNGYSLKITGGSDNGGFPMRPEIPGMARRAFLLKNTPGFHPKLKGQQKRKLVCGNTISQTIAQVNVKVIKAGEKKLEEIVPKIEKKEEAPKK
ncbi:MAG: 30S ribosomal protein S6e [Candidatus Aenigmarchaeota archaeon]|nr:30S ribosomal protein S6e [Candidatus Aenigmarchaeota archaeon]